MVAYYEARAGEYDDWYLRRGRYEHGPIHDAAWNAELDAAEAPLEKARDRLLAHGLRAHIHVRDAWAEPEGEPADALFAGFWLSHVERDRTAEFGQLAASWLRPDGRLALIDSLPDPSSGAVDHAPAANDRSIRRVADGRTFEIVKVFRTPDEVASSLTSAGFRDVRVTSTGRFFLLATATRR